MVKLVYGVLDSLIFSDLEVFGFHVCDVVHDLFRLEAHATLVKKVNGMRTFLGLLLLTQTLYSLAATVVVDEDEFILPPLFHDFLWNNETKAGGAVNVTSESGQKRSAQEDEWLEYGDQFKLAPALSISVISREKLVMVMGGVLQATLATPHQVVLDRGWIRVWKKADNLGVPFGIKTAQDEFIVKEGEFWINARSGVTDIYLITGEVRAVAAGRSYGPRTYFSFEGEAGGARYGAKAWDPKAMEVQIAGAFPGLMKLATKTQKEWDRGEPTKIYSDFRKKGWRKGSRLHPKHKVKRGPVKVP